MATQPVFVTKEELESTKADERLLTYRKEKVEIKSDKPIADCSRVTDCCEGDEENRKN
ncbi:hypothetical protein MTR_2g059190 [Medicago truncatula]|uniref:Uncharacterized protein n=1 Tax=Medicago truncatula TaxID=3880 RepID=G7IT10_MEDTR|nr:hypothetical protein MTR_2g059190 [Medicago truncatula]